MEEKKILEIFPIFTDQALDSEKVLEFYDYLIVAPYDHWPNENEYDEISRLISDVENLENKEFKNRLRLFYKYFEKYLKYSCKEIDIDERLVEENEIFQILITEDYVQRVECALKEIQMIKLFIPELSCILWSGYDFACIVLPRKASDKEWLYKVAEICNLHILEKAISDF